VDARSGGFAQITGSLLREAVNKATQLAGYSMARVLIIATQHQQAGLVMGAHAAEELLLGTRAFLVPIGDSDAQADVLATLRNSVFFRLSKDASTVEPARQSISAILLMTISGEDAAMIGLLHPEPTMRFDPATFEHVHFCKVRTRRRLRTAYHRDDVQEDSAPGRAEAAFSSGRTRLDAEGRYSQRYLYFSMRTFSSPKARVKNSFAAPRNQSRAASRSRIS
jgi:hypothetical protein